MGIDGHVHSDSEHEKVPVRPNQGPVQVLRLQRVDAAICLLISLAPGIKILGFLFFYDRYQ